MKVTPANAGVQNLSIILDSPFPGNDRRGVLQPVLRCEFMMAENILKIFFTAEAQSGNAVKSDSETVIGFKTGVSVMTGQGWQ